MTSTSNKTIEKSATDPLPVKAMDLPPGHPGKKSQEQTDTKDEKHKDFHPMRCHPMQPMQSTTSALFTETTPPNSFPQDSKK